MRTWCAAVLIGCAAAYALAENVSLPTYYPSPRGVYNELRTSGDAIVGKLASPSARLHVVQPNAAMALRVDDQAGDTTPFVIDQSGAVGVGTTAPLAGTKLDVQGGSINASGKLMEGGSPLVPAGSVALFNLGGCPAGWSQLGAASGRYLVGGTAGVTVGTALGNGEDRIVVAQHNHGVSDPGHSHAVSASDPGHNHGLSDPGHTHDYTTMDNGGSLECNGPCGAPYGTLSPQTWTATTGLSISSANANLSFGSAGTTVSVNPTGVTSGTNAPYLQLLVCQKD